MAKTKKRFVEILSTKITYLEGTPTNKMIGFENIIESLNHKEFRFSDKLFEVSILKTDLTDCVLGIISSIQDSDIPPIKNKQSKQYTTVNINPKNEGLAYANIFLYDKKRNILIYEINKNGCFPKQLIEFIYSKRNESKDEIQFELKFVAILRKDEYERMLRMDYYKKITLELYNPSELLQCYNEEVDSLESNLIKLQIDAAHSANANTMLFQQVALNKKLNPMGLSKSVVKGVVDAVKLGIVNGGMKKNIQKLEVDGYYSDIDGGRPSLKPVDLLADTFNEFFRIPEVQIQSDLQELDRKNGIESLYGKLLPEISSILGV